MKDIQSNLKIYLYLSPQKGGLAQLARAFDWQSKGHRFDSDILHFRKQRVTKSLVTLCYYQTILPTTTLPSNTE